MVIDLLPRRVIGWAAATACTAIWRWPHCAGPRHAPPPHYPPLPHPIAASFLNRSAVMRRGGVTLFISNLRRRLPPPPAPAADHRRRSAQSGSRRANRVLTYTISRERLALVVAPQLKQDDVLTALANLFMARGSPAHRREAALPVTRLRRSISTFPAVDPTRVDLRRRGWRRSAHSPG